MKTKPEGNMKTLIAKVPSEVHRALKIRSAEEGRSMAVTVEKLVREYLVKGQKPERGRP